MDKYRCKELFVFWLLSLIATSVSAYDVSGTGGDWRANKPYGGDWSFTGYQYKLSESEMELLVMSIDGSLTPSAFYNNYVAEYRVGSFGALKQYVIATKNADDNSLAQFEPAPVDKGVVTEMPNVNVGYNGLQWTMTASDVKTAWIDANPRPTEDAVAVRYMYDPDRDDVSNDESKDIYVVLKTGALTYTESGTITGTINWGSRKNPDYWYAKNSSMARSGQMEIHACVEGVENAVQSPGVSLDSPIYSCFQNDRIVDLTSNADMDDFITLVGANGYSGKDLSLDLQFVVGSQNSFKGIYNGNVCRFVTRVPPNDSKTLQAFIDMNNNGVCDINEACYTIAKLVYNGIGFDINHLVVELYDTDYAKALLNYSAANSLSDDALTAYVGVKAMLGDVAIPLEGDPINVRFLRPINVYGVGTTIENVAVNGQQVINLLNLVTLTDWRNQPFASGYWYYYGVTSIEPVGEAPEGFEYYPVILTSATGTSPDASAYGTIVYTNLGTEADSYTVQIPLKVKHLWGELYTTVNINIVPTNEPQNKRAIHVTTAGTLSNYISDTDKLQIEELTLTGEIDAIDIRLIREMAGCDYQGKLTDGKLKYLDILGVSLKTGLELYFDVESHVQLGENSYSSIDVSGQYAIESSNTIGNCMFAGCHLEQIVLPDGTELIGDYAFAYCQHLTSISLPDGVTAIGTSAFQCCNELCSIVIPDNVTSIGKWAFDYCMNLSTVVLPENLRQIGYASFADCSSLSDINLPQSVEEIGAFAFEDCSSLASVTLPSMIKRVPYAAFIRCKNLQNVVVPDNVEVIDSLAFCECDCLASVTLPSKLDSICYSAFAGCTSLSDIHLPQSVEEIGTFAFNGCSSLASITLPPAIKRIPYGAFAYCENLQSIVIPNNVEVVDSFAFYCCYRLASVTLSSKLDSICCGAFVNCTSLLDISLPTSLKYIGEQTFGGCTSLSSLNIPRNVENMGLGIVGECTAMTSFTVDSNNPYFRSINNGIVDKRTNMLVQSCKTTEIPTDIIGIADYGYIFVQGVEEVVIPENVKSIGASAFQDCNDLKRVTIPKAIETISGDAFYGCNNLEQVTILNPVPVPIEDNVFYLRSEENEGDADDFEFTHATLYVPCGSKAAYQAADGWKNFTNIVELPDTNRKPGDLNGDGEVNGTDLVLLINMILSGMTSEDADLNGDGEVNGTDYVMLVNIILGISASRPVASAEWDDNPATSVFAEPFDIRCGETRELVISMDNPDQAVTLVQMDMQLPAGLSLKSNADEYDISLTNRDCGHTLLAHDTGRGMRMMLASSSNAVIEGDEGSILRLTITASDDYQGGDIVLKDILCTSPNLMESKPRNYVLHLLNPTGIDDSRSKKNETAVYSVMGTRLGTPRKGVNIVNRKKVIVK